MKIPTMIKNINHNNQNQNNNRRIEVEPETIQKNTTTINKSNNKDELEWSADSGEIAWTEKDLHEIELKKDLKIHNMNYFLLFCLFLQKSLDV